MHLNDGQIRAYLDGESCTGITRQSLEGHLASCVECHERLAQMKTRAAFVEQQFARLAPAADDAAPELKRRARFALADLKQKLKPKETSIMKRLFDLRLRPLGVLGLLAAVLTVTLSIPTGRTWAGQFLGLFRVQQVRVIPVEMSGLEQFNTDSTLQNQMSDVISSSITIRKEPAEARLAVSAEEAAQMAGFSLRLPADMTPAQIFVDGGSAFDVKVDRQRIQSFLDEIGRNDLQLPETVDGAEISVDIPDGVGISYGDCPQLKTGEEEEKDNDRETMVSHPQCTLLAEIPSPTVNTPPDLDLAQLAEIALEFSGMTTEEARAFTESVDWTSSLVVPLPKEDVKVEQVNVDDVEGTLITREQGYGPRYVLLWVKDGIIYSINGFGMDASKALEMADTLQ